ncbi:CHAP domain-containing protein [Maridesulfovibrio zosterae]|uniref:CHAP domain-containing protein n=1 Tax=Maridesulfovibrio zosterae TaxID=82171 RepID=UPI000411650F|nr:CHAP domain-containing protein [Maridesulfovibrio zosterae]
MILFKKIKFTICVLMYVCLMSCSLVYAAAKGHCTAGVLLIKSGAIDNLPSYGLTGHAYSWYDNAKDKKIDTGSKPELGAIAVWKSNTDVNPYGHVAVVVGFDKDNNPMMLSMNDFIKKGIDRNGNIRNVASRPKASVGNNVYKYCTLRSYTENVKGVHFLGYIYHESNKIYPPSNKIVYDCTDPKNSSILNFKITEVDGSKRIGEYVTVTWNGPSDEYYKVEIGEYTNFGDNMKNIRVLSAKYKGNYFRYKLGREKVGKYYVFRVTPRINETVRHSFSFGVKKKRDVPKTDEQKKYVNMLKGKDFYPYFYATKAGNKWFLVGKKSKEVVWWNIDDKTRNLEFKIFGSKEKPAFESIDVDYNNSKNKFYIKFGKANSRCLSEGRVLSGKSFPAYFAYVMAADRYFFIVDLPHQAVVNWNATESKKCYWTPVANFGGYNGKEPAGDTLSVYRDSYGRLCFR